MSTILQMRPVAVGSDALSTLVDELSRESLASATTRAASAYDEFATPFGGRLVICGAGQLGRFVFDSVAAAGIEPVAYCDNNSSLWGTEIKGLAVLSPTDAAARFGGNAAFLAAVYNASGLRRQLASLGNLRVVPYPAFFWKCAALLSREERLELPQRVLARVHELRPAYDLLADDRSRAEFLAQVRWRCLLDYSCLPAHDQPRDMYFAQDVYELRRDEVLFDCGAFDGDSIRPFLERTAGEFRGIYAFEPDPDNRSKLRDYLATLPAEAAGRIRLMPYALGSSDGVVRFEAEGSVGSRLGGGATGTIEVERRSLDGLAAAMDRPTLVKMDIEGAEVEAIPGLRGLARESRPVIAACAYHRCEHLWQMPLLLREANPEYRIFLRRYAEECWETVYYAVPPERVRR